MKRNVLKIFTGIIFTGVCLIFYVVNTSSAKPTGTIDLKGGNDLWHASLNIHLQYDTELIIQPARDDFKIPSEISADIIINNKCVYTGKLEYATDSTNKDSLGTYRVRINSDDIIPSDYFKKNNNEVYIIVRFNGQISSVLLR
jgi:hypothetical protein